MLIKYQALMPHLKHKLQSIYVLQGSDPYLVNDASYRIKKAWRDQDDTDEKIIYLNHLTDWQILIEEANSYSLFSEQIILHARYEKKSIDANSQLLFNRYLQNINPKSLIILELSAIPIKQLQWLSNHSQVILVQIISFDKTQLLQWINNQLTQLNIHYSTEIVFLIHQYTQGNMLACAQLIDKLTIIADKPNKITEEEIRAHLIDQCEYQLYKLADACLNADPVKALHLLTLAMTNRTEPSLILWLMTQEIRHLIQLTQHIQQKLPFSLACEKQKIWPKRAKLYEKTLARLPLTQLYQLLQTCKHLDTLIKTNKINLVWLELQRLALYFTRNFDENSNQMIKLRNLQICSN